MEQTSVVFSVPASSNVSRWWGPRSSVEASAVGPASDDSRFPRPGRYRANRLTSSRSLLRRHPPTLRATPPSRKPLSKPPQRATMLMLRTIPVNDGRVRAQKRPWLVANKDANLSPSCLDVVCCSDAPPHPPVSSRACSPAVSLVPEYLMKSRALHDWPSVC